MLLRFIVAILSAGLAVDSALAGPSGDLAARVARVELQVIAVRRDIHAHPELGFEETRTAALVAAQLRSLGMQVREGVGKTGVVGVLRGGKPGRTVALRADMDALPVTEQTGLPFASTVRTTYNGQDVGVMHACGHDAHTAILLGVANVLSEMRAKLPGTILFLFQPAEEGGGPSETGGAEAMLADGAFDDPRPEGVFGLHIGPQHVAGDVSVVGGPAMAAADRFSIRVRGRQTHAAMPWAGVDPIAVASRIVLAIEALPGREINLATPALVSVGAIHGGVRHNIIPEEVELIGTVRTLDEEARSTLHRKIERVATNTAEASGATAEVEIVRGYGVLVNDVALTAWGRTVLEAALGAGHVHTSHATTTAEDFSYYARRVPGMFFWLGGRDPATPLEDAAPNHSPRFVIDERSLTTGVRALAELAVAFTGAGKP